LSALTTAPVAISLPPPTSSSEPPQSTKKKQKKKPAPIIPASNSENSKSPAPVDWRSLLDDMGARPPIQTVLLSHSLFSAVDDFIRLTSLPEVNLDLLLSVTLRTLDALAIQVNNITSSPSSGAPINPNALIRIGTVLHHVLKMSLVSLTQRFPQTVEQIITLLDRTTNLILIPLICAFNTRSEIYLGSLFLPSPDGSMTGPLKPPAASPQYSITDIRADMLDLFKETFFLLDGCLQSHLPLPRPSMVSRTFRVSLILETLREFDRVLSVTPVTSSHVLDRGVDPKQHQSDRVKQLALKDSLWYLCTVLHLLFEDWHEKSNRKDDHDVSGLDNDIMGKGARLLSEKVSDTLIQLISRCTRVSSNSLKPSKFGGESEAQHERSQFRPRSSSRSYQSVEAVVEERGKARSHDGATDGDAGREDSGGRMVTEKGDVCADADIDVSVAGRWKGGNCSDQRADSAPQSSKLRDEPRQDHCGEIVLDDVGYAMLLGVLERYWVWSGSWDL
ncbi:hypothetical protein H0H87_002311, partial [Tephrocybe sp. NHM501043]